jgi:hypothetical protein
MVVLVYGNVNIAKSEQRVDSKLIFPDKKAISSIETAPKPTLNQAIRPRSDSQQNVDNHIRGLPQTANSAEKGVSIEVHIVKPVLIFGLRFARFGSLRGTILVDVALLSARVWFGSTRALHFRGASPAVGDSTEFIAVLGA